MRKHPQSDRASDSLSHPAATHCLREVQLSEVGIGLGRSRRLPDAYLLDDYGARQAEALLQRATQIAKLPQPWKRTSRVTSISPKTWVLASREDLPLMGAAAGRRVDARRQGIVYGPGVGPWSLSVSLCLSPSLSGSLCLSVSPTLSLSLSLTRSTWLSASPELYVGAPRTCAFLYACLRLSTPAYLPVYQGAASGDV